MSDYAVVWSGRGALPGQVVSDAWRQVGNAVLDAAPGHVITSLEMDIINGADVTERPCAKAGCERKAARRSRICWKCQAEARTRRKLEKFA